ncbi:MAG: hypothetical protein WAU12_13905 [Saprospiraceae bacterium]|jgi:hypothetical protein|uniref:hypothetical protein n=1 Tax=Candidatus Brachybacter algidus TaxID=2982024 RepID=UPI001B63C832|nr:hypothetical protein [Candidatus Brachybacter algidus]MBP7306470.1 hypothetical protein [Saprospiraceae bacterium]MBK7605199.1 hypothetical protein [Candidatus Brachybacter algidus]MBK8357447.1 hypothetical protein [Candidatus Brachybacter algidus]MBK8842412.1 hypothetical protein [Candidatus Brachybacter algidus]MBK9023703.1 hypothetical protein [Candidatus Brachybacter algidus]
MLIYRVLGMKCWLEKTVFGFSRWEYDIEPVKSSASFKNTKLVKTYVPYVPTCFN